MDGATILLATILAPLALLPLLLVPASRATGLRLAPWAPLPALLLALAAPPQTRLELPGVLLGSVFGLDDSGRLFLLFTALVWLLAGWFARGWLRDDARAWRFWTFFLATQAGNLGVCLALDALSFYLLFALMTFAAYGLVVHAATAEALRAGRVYLSMAVLGEALLVAGMLLAAHAADSVLLAEIAAGGLPAPAVALLVAGFGVKVGLPLLHMWLPLAHPVAPVPASAVLSGVMLKAGLLGWLRFLPLGAQAMPEAGAAMMVAGLLAMFLGVAAGLAQRNAKVLLAYSSVSQMGFMTLAVGAGLLAPALWPLLLPAVGLYALHHALAKSALFLGVGLVRLRGASRARLAGLALPALALAGAPLTSGMLAKEELKHALDGLAAPWPALLAGLLPLAAVGTALLMLRLLWLSAGKPGEGGGEGLHAPWAMLLLAVAGMAWWWAPASLAPAALASALWPPLLALAIHHLAARAGFSALAIPPGDVVVPLEFLAARLAQRIAAIRTPRFAGLAAPPRSLRTRAENVARIWPLAGAMWLGLLILLLAGLFG